MPTHPVMARSRPNRHPPGVLDEAVGEPPSQAGSELGMVLEVPLPTVRTHKPAAVPHQRGTSPGHLQVTDPLRSPVPHTTTAEPTVRAPRPLPGRFHLDLEAVNRVNQHSPYANTPQVQTNGHKIRHRGLLASAICYFTDSSGASPPFQGFPPHPTFPRSAGRIAGYDVVVQAPVVTGYGVCRFRREGDNLYHINVRGTRELVYVMLSRYRSCVPHMSGILRPAKVRSPGYGSSPLPRQQSPRPTEYYRCPRQPSTVRRSDRGGT